MIEPTREQERELANLALTYSGLMVTRTDAYLVVFCLREVNGASYCVAAVQLDEDGRTSPVYRGL